MKQEILTLYTKELINAGSYVCVDKNQNATCNYLTDSGETVFPVGIAITDAKPGETVSVLAGGSIEIEEVIRWGDEETHVDI